jgi:Ca-activated chloride channel family protein
MRTPFVAVLLVLSTALCPPALLASAAAGPVMPETSSDDAPPRLQLVLDASGSMREKATGGTRLEIAKKALADVIRNLPPEAETGLRVYGATVDTGPRACTDSQEVVEPATGNRDELLRAVRGHQALGETPIGFALQEAAEDLGDEGQRTIVLVSDGEPTCEPDPCVVARELTQQGIGLKVDVVGLDVSPAVRERLACIAEAGDGTYYDADDAPTLTRSLSMLSVRAARPFGVDGLPVEGTLATRGAPVLGAGQYVDRMPLGTIRGDTALHYRVTRTVPGSTIHVGTSLRSTAGLVLSTYISVYDVDGDLCASELGQAINVYGARALITTSASSWKSDAEDPCNTGEYVDVQVAHSDDKMAREPFELVVYEEPPVADPQSLGPATDSFTWKPMGGGRGTRPAEPGTSISDAPVLEPGAYDLDIMPGETQVFAVPVSWGERLQAQATVGPRRGGLGDLVSSSARMELRIFDPVRRETSPLLDVAGMPDSDSRFDGDRPYNAYAAIPPVNYLNRADPDLASGSIAGLRFVEVNYTGGATSDDAYLLPYRLDVETAGDASVVEPSYDDSTLSAPPVPDPAELVAMAAVGGAPRTEQSPSASPTPDQQPAEAGPTAASTDDGGLTWLAIAAALLVLAAVALGFLLGRRRS